MDKNVIKKIIKNYIELCKEYTLINENLNFKKIRRINFPESVSENIILNFLEKQNMNYKYNWDIKKGDLFNETLQKQIEVKCVASKGPISFGPNQLWDELYILDIRKIEWNFIPIKIFHFNSNDKNKFYNIKVNKNETIKDQCEQKRRPRINLSSLINNENFSCIFDGNLNEII